jgi:Na+/H+ antiporter NhaD/arsenite permease-like protein
VQILLRSATAGSGAVAGSLGAAAAAEGAAAAPGPAMFGVPVDFVLFAVVLLGVAVFHHRTFTVAVAGLAAIAIYKLAFTGFRAGPGFGGLFGDLWHERVILGNLFLLLLGFAILSRHFEESKVPDLLPRILPERWTGGLFLLALVFALSAFLDNIAGALIGGVAARYVFQGKVHIGYLAAIVAASNAGGAGSVVGDTTTTMMWIAGVSPLDVLHAYIAAAAAFVVFAVPASIVQHNHSRVHRVEGSGVRVDWVRVLCVAVILVSAIGANVSAHLFAPALLDVVPVIGLAVWAAIAVCALARRPDLHVLRASVKGTMFLLALVTSASLMPVERLPEASWLTALGLGAVSAVFDNIPLTALALKQGGYDWGVLAYTVGFGGSMIWFGSSAGVAISNLYPEARSVVNWLRHGWWIAIGYVVGFFALLWTLGWNPHAPHRGSAASHGIPAAVAEDG